MTILLRLEKPDMQLTVCGMISQQWLDGLLSGAIAQSQGGLTPGQLAWRETHRQNAEAPEYQPTTRPANRPRPRRRRAGSALEQRRTVLTRPRRRHRER